MERKFTKDDADAAARTHSRGDSYDNIEPWFEKMTALEADDPHRGELREEIMRRCLPLAEHIARRFAGRGETFDDLHQIARVGLVLSVDRFDVARGSSFLSFAVPTIMGEVRRHFRDNTWAVRVPRRLKEIQQLIGPATELLSNRLGRVPTAHELAAELSVDVGTVTQALIASNGYQTRSLDTVMREDSENTPLPVAAGLGADEPCYRLLEESMTVRPLIAALPERERRVLIMRFFESMTQAQIAERLGVSQMQVSRILAKTLDTLREQALEPEQAMAVA
ncbi:SigB/SigF/SigG family RNA polymerase sigma factor [Nocardia brasiliensis]|uniref:SigB/SigF/SigG family RNA polymerase sigma factor n=1 Tax=Nocardia brasiliensis TaxID=37326 RepID=A0A6G9XP76_NOCBR|nr:RNA polymerase sigma factor SigF [Nocardia brasiliensis]QIS02643.1 SigB/SigF/SigG family RNA polymerase sigma factor [Nocardia brasiliensis]